MEADDQLAPASPIVAYFLNFMFNHLPGAGSVNHEALGTCRQAVISAQTQVKVAGPVYHGCQMVTSAIDALAQLITGSAYYFHAEATQGTPGEPNWSSRPASSRISDGAAPRVSGRG